MPPSTTLLRRAFVDVCRGYSVGTLRDQTVYIRHLGHFAHVGYEDIEDGFKRDAVAQGALTEAQRLDQLYAKGTWSPTREGEANRQRDSIARMEDGRKTIAVPSVLRSHEEHIGRERKKLMDMLLERARTVGETAETYASRRLEDYYLVSNLFADKGLTTPLLTFEAFDALGDDEVEAIHQVYRVATEPCSDANLRRLAVQDFFASYWALAQDDAQAFYGRAVCELTYYQVRLCNYARYMKALLDNTDLLKLSPEQRNDPDAIERINTTQRNQAAMTAEGKVPVGLSSQDAKEMGVQFSPVPPPGLSGVELVRWMQKQQAAGPR